MLHVVADPPLSRLSDDKALVDVDRGIVFTLTGSGSMGRVTSFLLRWNDQVIPVDVRGPNLDGEASSAPTYSDIQINGVAAVMNSGCDPISLSAPQRDAALLIVIECVLAFGMRFDGLERDRYTLSFGSKSYTLKDFGYFA
jgi:hypothetical protein